MDEMTTTILLTAVITLLTAAAAVFLKSWSQKHKIDLQNEIDAINQSKEEMLKMLKDKKGQTK